MGQGRDKASRAGFRGTSAGQGSDDAPGTPDALAKHMRSEYDQWKKTIAAAKLKLD